MLTKTPQLHRKPKRAFVHNVKRYIKTALTQMRSGYYNLNRDLMMH